jgi:hypothetical protein
MDDDQEAAFLRHTKGEQPSLADRAAFLNGSESFVRLLAFSTSRPATLPASGWTVGSVGGGVTLTSLDYP